MRMQVFSQMLSHVQQLLKKVHFKKCINRELGFDIDVFDALYFRKLC